jgi:hypothetical protein
VNIPRDPFYKIAFHPDTERRGYIDSGCTGLQFKTHALLYRGYLKGITMNKAFLGVQ